MILTLSHQKGGVGKSTIAWNLALELSKSLQVDVIDLDMQQSLSAANAIRQTKKLHTLNISHYAHSDELVARLQQDLEDRLIIIDSGGFDSAFNRVAILASELLITPVSDKPFDLMGLQKYEEILKTLSQIQGTLVQTHVLLNNLNPSLRNYGDIVEFVQSSDHFQMVTSVLRQRADYAHSIGVGKSVLEYSPQGKAAAEFTTLRDEIKTLLNIK
ncbi:MAG: ParA family protein [Campylobacterales bacterium]|nr:ParA family protein [Campylobacterales bacterium]